ncbi:transposase [Rhodanobacter sp. C05]|uniref:transposase n=1 Tax=Rhodanobacter sp. C05 TaxID=1945855 RepID=UPI00117B3C7B|nr:transposase [Rhodanobacter sp. C05]
MPKPGPRTTTRYSDEFKATAVRLSSLPGVLVQDVAASLYIHPFMLSRWRKQAREGKIMTKGVTVDPAVSAELKELRRVKKACEQLKLEHDVLKKRSRSLPLEKRTLCLHRAAAGNRPGEMPLSPVRRQRQRLLRVA